MKIQKTKMAVGLAAILAGAAAIAYGVGVVKSSVQAETVTVGEKVGALTPAVHSGGTFTIEHRRQCQPGQMDVSHRPVLGALLRTVRPMLACGLLSSVSGHNALTNEGANDVWATYFASSGRSVGNTWYVGLTSATPSATSTLANITEISGNGYARQAITWDFSTARHAKTGNVVFTATAAWLSGATYLFITNTSSGTTGKMFNYLALSATRTPAANGDTITVSWDGNL